MPWVKFSDDWYDDGKIAGADPWVIAMWAVGLTWCARNLSDGHIPAGEHRRFLNLYDTFDSEGQQVHPDRVADELVRRGSWQAVAGGYEVVNYHRYQPTRDEVLSKRESERVRKASGRNPGGRGKESAQRPDPPVPVPDTSSSSSSTSDPVPPAVWDALARKRLAVARDVRNVPSWLAKVVKNDRAELGEKATWIYQTYEITESQLVDVLAAGGTSSLLNSLRKRKEAS